MKSTVRRVVRPLLGVNVDHIATLRQARGAVFPDPVEAALACQASGADSIVAHLREDRRHIQDADVHRLCRLLRIKFNLECSIDPGVLKTVFKAKPQGVTFVPERRLERTTESGLRVSGREKKWRSVVEALKKMGIEVSLFVDPIASEIEAAHKVGAHAIEIHTGDYANASTSQRRRKHLDRIRDAVRRGRRLKLTVHVGHGLDYQNTHAVARISGITEFNIGYAIVVRALQIGLPQAVREMKRILHKDSRPL